jgi:chromatin assembly factor 1 subunit A
MHFLNQPLSSDPSRLLSTLPRKHLQFAEDIRPAYNGTFSRHTRLTPRNPFKRDNEAFAYDYDSEAEWEFEPEDGENLDDESVADDDEGSMMGDSGDEEDRAFLDDEDDEDAVKYKSKGKTGKRVIAPLVPMVKGVCWEVGGTQKDEVLASMKAGMLLFNEKGDGIRTSIDPFSAEYWITDMAPPPLPKLDSQFRLKSETSGGSQSVKGSTKPKAAFPDALLRDFLKAIQGSRDNQNLLVELLKKQ